MDIPKHVGEKKAIRIEVSGHQSIVSGHLYASSWRPTESQSYEWLYF